MLHEPPVPLHDDEPSTVEAYPGAHKQLAAPPPPPIQNEPLGQSEQEPVVPEQDVVLAVEE